MPPLPSGFVTFLFTDLEGSTRLHHRLADRYAELIGEHDRLLGEIVTAHGGTVVKSLGDGVFAAFPEAAEAVAAAAEIQRRISAQSWPDGVELRVRAGLHAGVAVPHGSDYVALAVNQAARVCAAAHGGQVLLTDVVETAAELPSAGVLDLGEHRLKDFDRPVSLRQWGTATFPPPRTQSVTNLPRSANSFVGRATDVAAVVSLIRGGARFLTLTGPGGVGKTRLAIESASAIADSFPAGVFWVELKDVREGPRALAATASTLGTDRPLAEHIGARHVLIVLDNLEQVVEVAPALASLVETCPNLQLLLTSRERLRVRGETTYPVEPLATEDAAELFAARSGVITSPDVRRLAEAVDRLPLGVELAAARARVLSVRQILTRLGSRLDSLKGGRDAEPRQRTLRGAIAWSYELLDDDERRAFARLAVFRGGCTVDAAEAVAEADVEVLASLVDKSLLVGGSERVGYLSTIHEFARECLDASGEAARMAGRHSAWYVDLVRTAHIHLHGADQEQWLDAIYEETDNLRAVLDRALVDDVPNVFDLANALVRPWRASGLLPELVAWYRVALPAAESLDAATRATTLATFGTALLYSEHHDEAEERLTAAVELSRAAGDDAGEASALNQLGSIAWVRGDSRRAHELQQAALRIFRRLGDEHGVSRCLHLIGEQLRDSGELAEAIEALEESIAIEERRGDLHAVMSSTHSLGDVWLDAGELDRARAGYRRALGLAAALGDELSVSYCLAGLACVLAGEEEVMSAGWLWGAAEAIERRIGQPMLAKERQRYTEVLGRLAGDVLFRAARRDGAATPTSEMVRRWAGRPES